MGDQYLTGTVGAFAAALGMGPDTLRRRLAAAGVQAFGKRGGRNVYKLSDVWRAVQPQDDDASGMRPHDRLSLARAVETEDRVRRQRGELCEAGDVERTMAGLASKFLRTAETLPDILERDAGLPPHAVALVEKAVDRLRYALADELETLDDESTDDHGEGRGTVAPASPSHRVGPAKALRGGGSRRSNGRSDTPIPAG